MITSEGAQSSSDEKDKRRWDDPKKLSYKIGKLPKDLSDATVREDALEALRDDMWAATSKRPMEAKLATVEKMLKHWNYELLPFSREKVLALGAALKLGSYRSAATYVFRLQRLRGEAWSRSWSLGTESHPGHGEEL